MKRSTIVLLAASAVLSLAASAQSSDPSKAEVSLHALNGWRGSLVLDNDVGVWALRTLQLLPRYGCPEIIALDDKGRCTVLVSYSGKWTPLFTVQDEQWLGTAMHVDLDPQKPGKELYVGGKRGVVYQIWPHPAGGFDTRIVARFPGLEIHTMISGEFLGQREGDEALLFARSGEVFDLRVKSTQGLSEFEAKRIARLPGRVRDALVLPCKLPGQLRIIAALRAQRVMEIKWDAKGIHATTLLRESMGFGRIARKPIAPGNPEVLYVTRDDGAVLRLQELGNGTWKRSVIFAGPQGPRGLAAGRFHSDPNAETVAVFGYSKKVQLLTKLPDEAWKVETIFIEKDKGHWLSTAEVDGRNGTDELVGSGYGARVFLLSRPPGYGMPEVPTESTEPPKAPKRSPKPKVGQATPRIPRLGVSATRLELKHLSPLSYGGGFETKTLLFETLVTKAHDGSIAPGLATSWEVDKSGTQFTFHLRANAKWHDNTKVTAKHIVQHFRRWVGNPAHNWLGATQRIREVAAMTPTTVRVILDRPYALLEDLCALNPCAVIGPDSGLGSGNETPIGSGPWTLVPPDAPTNPLRYVSQTSARQLDVVRFTEPSTDLFNELIEGRLDIILSPWNQTHLHRRLPELHQHPEIQLSKSIGSAVTYLNVGAKSKLITAKLRRALFHHLDREALVEEVLRGHGTPCATWAPPSVDHWSEAGTPAAPAKVPWPQDAPKVLRLAVGSLDNLPLAMALRQQLKSLGVRLDFIPLSDHAEALRSESYDLRIESTWGLPFEPLLSLKARFLPAKGQSPLTTAPHVASEGLGALIQKAANTPLLKQRIAIYGQIQAWMDQHVPVIPLYAPHRIGLSRKPFPPPILSPDQYRIG